MEDENLDSQNDADRPVDSGRMAVPPELANAVGFEIREGRWYVQRSKAGVYPALTDGKIPVRPFVAPPVYVSTRYGVTVNLGNYESARVEVGISMPCYLAEADGVAEWQSKWVGDRVGAEREELLREVSRRREGDGE